MTKGPALRFFGHDRANGLLDGAIQDVVVEEEVGTEGLVLSRGGDLLLHRQVGEESLDLRCTHLFGVALVVEEDEAFDPANVRFFDANGVMLAAQSLTDTVEELGRAWGLWRCI